MLSHDKTQGDTRKKWKPQKRWEELESTDDTRKQTEHEWMNKTKTTRDKERDANHQIKRWCFHFGRWRCFWASFEKFFDEIVKANYRWELTEEQGKYFERYLRLTSRQKTQNKYHILTSVPLYIKSAIGFRSFGCCNWSESLIWHKTLSLLLGPMLIDVHLSSIVHQFLQWLYICIPTGNEMFLRTWPTNAYPYVGCRNTRRRQLSVY